jgi:hypothetical protein
VRRALAQLQARGSAAPLSPTTPIYFDEALAMKILNRRVTAAIAVLAAGLLAAWLVSWNRHRRAEEPAILDRSRPSSMAATTVSPAVSPEPMNYYAAKGAPSLPVPDGSAMIDDLEDNLLADVLQRVLSNDPQLAAFKHYHRRPLLDEASKARYRELLSDSAVLASVKHDLLSPEEIKADQAGDIKRLMKIDYLREALEWKKNPVRRSLIALVAELILTDNFPPGMGMDMRLSLSGNKRELYALLYEVAPDQAKSALRASRGTRLEKLIAYIDDSLQTQRRLEAGAETEVSP